MDISKISKGDNFPHDVNVIIEITKGGGPVKYEFDKESGALLVDRLIKTPLNYPENYGFIPHTLGQDGDPIDVLVVDHHGFLPGSVISCRPIGMLKMTDDKGADEKIIAVPSPHICGIYSHMTSYTDLPTFICDNIAYFFKHYKDLEANRWAEIGGFEDAEAARNLIAQSVV